MSNPSKSTKKGERKQGQMRKSEKVWIILLLVILVIAIVAYATNKNKDKASNNSTSAGSSSSTSQSDSNASTDATDSNDSGAVDPTTASDDQIANLEFVTRGDDGTNVNTSTKLSEKKDVNGLTFDDISLTEKDNQTVLLANVTNNSGKDTGTDPILVDVIFLDKDGKEITTIDGIISPLKAGESTQFNASTTLSYVNAYDFQIKIKDNQ